MKLAITLMNHLGVPDPLIGDLVERGRGRSRFGGLLAASRRPVIKAQ